MISAMRLESPLRLRPWVASFGLVGLLWFVNEKNGDGFATPVFASFPICLLATVFWWRATFQKHAAFASLALGTILVAVYDYDLWVDHIAFANFPLVLGVALWTLGLYEYESAQRQKYAISVFRFLVIEIYFFAALAKVNAAFLSGFVLEQAYLADHVGSLANSEPPLVLFQVLSWLTVGFEFSLALGLAFKFTRSIAVLGGIVFHILAAILLPVCLFSATMVLSLLLILD